MANLKDGYIPKTATLDAVTLCLTGRPIGIPQSMGTSPTFEVKGGSVNIYLSNQKDQPADKTEMTLDSCSPFVEDVYDFLGQVRWILFEAASGTPIVNTLNLLK